MTNNSVHNQFGISTFLAKIAGRITSKGWVFVLLTGLLSQIGISAAQETDSTAYIVLQYEVTDQAMYQEYIQGVRATQAGHEMKLLVTDSNTESLEGEALAPRTVILSFPTPEQAMAWYQSDAYQQIVQKRIESTTGITTLVNARDPG
ncbi:MAG: DUF1330 domain-containing protein [Proteobacteria bacterium]|jgi:uncharacterized protein (DUF1330 family)|nr:DUF1330 domain-containing protein [Pseudomonadota bacterium]